MGVAKAGLIARKAQAEQVLLKLALERIQAANRIEELDHGIQMGQLAIQVTDAALRDVEADEAIENAKGKAADEAAQNETKEKDG